MGLADEIRELEDIVKFEKILDVVLPYEQEPHQAEFDCMPNYMMENGKLRHDDSAYQRRQDKQTILDTQFWERQRIRDRFLFYIYHR